MEHPAGVEPAPPTWRAGVRPRTPRARKVNWRSRAESNRFVPRLQLGAFPVGDSTRERRRGESNSRGLVPARLARECAKPTCTSSPSQRKAEGSNLSGSAPRPGFSGPVAGHSAAPSKPADEVVDLGHPWLGNRGHSVRVAGRQRFERCLSALETDCSPRSTDPFAWRARESNPSRVACKASLRPGGLPTRSSGQGGRNRTCVDLVPGQVASH